MKPIVNATYRLSFTEGGTEGHYHGLGQFTGVTADIDGMCYQFVLPERGDGFFPEESIIEEIFKNESTDYQI